MNLISRLCFAIVIALVPFISFSMANDDFIIDAPFPAVSGFPSDIRVKGATPGGLVAVVFGKELGTFTLDSVCSGLDLEIKDWKLLKVKKAEENGKTNIFFKIPKKASGRFFFQAVDISSCTASNISATRINQISNTDLIVDDLSEDNNQDEIPPFVQCGEIRTNLLEFQNRVRTTSVHKDTGDSMNYLLVGNPLAKEAIIFVPGTFQVIPDWPAQIFTNTDSSPNLEEKLPNSENSLCSKYLLIFIDYPGVAGSKIGPDGLTFQNISKDIAEVIKSVDKLRKTKIEKLYLTGWSLGTFTSLRFAQINPENTKIGKLFLSGVKPGGGAVGNQAGCMFDLFKERLEATSELRQRKISNTIFRLMFPYVDQVPYDGLTDACSTINKITLKPNITLGPCSVDSKCTTTPCNEELMCGRTLNRFLINRTLRISKWNGGIGDALYSDQRALDDDYNECSCFPNDSSCTCLPPTTGLNPLNGGPCACEEITSNFAECFPSGLSPDLGCSELSTTEGIVVFNGKEDIFIQYLFGTYLSIGYNDLSSGFATFINYDESTGEQAGHGLPHQSPSWMQDQIYNQLNP